MIVSQERAFLNAQARLEEIRRHVEQAADSGECIDRVERELFAQLLEELLSRVVFRGSESGGVPQDSVGEDSSFENKNDLVIRVESSSASAR
jgi:hypothetical protein